jgi:hypothetical protein
MACTAAVQRAVAAIALRFAQEHDDVGDDVAEALGASDGEPFLQRYAKHEAETGAVQDVQFDPVEHLCMATVRWKPPLFIEEAVLKYAARLKEQETQGPETASKRAAPPAAPATAAPPAAPAAAPPSAASVAPAASSAAPAPARPAAPQCKRPRRKLDKALAGGRRALADYEECSRRTDGDDTICHRYKLYVEEAQRKERSAGEGLCDCLNQHLSTAHRQALHQSLRGHAAVAVETRADGTLILWTFSPVHKTAFAFEVSPSGEAAGQTPLAANQVQWVRGQLGL